jgi:hypothetical protein
LPNRRAATTPQPWRLGRCWCTAVWSASSCGGRTRCRAPPLRQIQPVWSRCPLPEFSLLEAGRLRGRFLHLGRGEAQHWMMVVMVSTDGACGGSGAKVRRMPSTAASDSARPARRESSIQGNNLAAFRVYYFRRATGRPVGPSFGDFRISMNLSADCGVKH